MPAKKRTIRSIPQERTPVREQPPTERVGNFLEVSLGYDEAEASREAARCLFCAEPICMDGCPVSIDIPGFIRRISDKDYRGAYDIIAHTNLLRLPQVGQLMPCEELRPKCPELGVFGKNRLQCGVLKRHVVGRLPPPRTHRAVGPGQAAGHTSAAATGDG